MYRILGILPYVGLCNTVERVSAKFKNLVIDTYVGDLEKGVEVLNSQNLSKYDAIISRGGTSKLITKETSLPVIDIGVSKYDIIHAIQTTQKLKKIAFVGFGFLVDKAHNVIADFQKDISIFTINSAIEAKEVILNLQKQDYDVVIGDTVTTRMANDLAMRSLLISSDEESIEMAISKALDIAYYSRKNRDIDFILRRFLENNNEAILLLDDKNGLKQKFNLHGEQRMLPHIKKRVNLGKVDNEVFKSQGKYYLIRQDELYSHLLYISHLAYYDGNHNSPFKMSELESNLFETAFQALYSLEEQQSLKSMMDDHLPIIIKGSHGTGKKFVLNKTLKNKDNIIRISPFNTNINNLLDSRNTANSPLFATNNIVVFDKFNKFKPQDRGWIMEFINQTLLFKRSKLFFVLEQTAQDDLLDIKKMDQIFHLVQLRSIEKIDNVAANNLVTLLINELNRNFGKNIIGLTDIAMDWFVNVHWDNRLRQILFTLLNAYHIAEGPYINIKELKLSYRKELVFENVQLYDKKKNKDKYSIVVDLSNPTSLEDLTKQLVKNVLVKNDYNKTKTAQQLKISRTTLWRMLNKF